MKLAANSNLQQGRYRIIGAFADAANYTLYDAYDNLLGNKIVVHETVLNMPKAVSASDRATISAEFAGRVKHLASLRHEGIVRVRDGFSEADRQYLVTEPVEAAFGAEDFTQNAGETISRLLLAVQLLANMSAGSGVEIGPSRIRRTPDGNNRLLFFGFAQNPAADASLAPFQPLEMVWNSLDVATRKAISNEYDDEALVILESKLDERSNIYALAATVFRILTGSDPAGALERSVEMLEGKGDPLSSLISVQGAMPAEIRSFIAKAMELRREKRYENAELASAALATRPENAAQKELEDLLELLPFEPAAPVEAQASFEPLDVIIDPAIVPAAVTLAEIEATAEPMRESKAVSVPSKEAKAASVPVATAGASQVEFSLPTGSDSRSAGSGKMIAIAIAAVVVIGIAVFAVMNLGSSSDTPANPSAGVQSAPVGQDNPIPEQTAVPAEKTAVADVAPLQSVPASSDIDVSSPSRQRASAAEVKPVKKETPKPAEKTAAKPKKSVTVDDLIGDN